MSGSWSTRMRLLPEAVSDTLLDVHETHVYQPLRKGLEKVAALSFFPRAVLPNHVTWMSMACALPFVLLTFYGWHFAAAALTIFHDMLDRLDGAVAGALRKPPDVRVDGPRVPPTLTLALTLTLMQCTGCGWGASSRTRWALGEP